MIRTPSAARAGLAAPLLLLLLAVTAVPPAGARDTSGTSRHVRVDATGVTVEERARSARTDTLEFREVRNGTTRVGIGRHTILIDDSDEVVRMFSDITIESGERVVGDVVALCGSVTVRGEVSGNVVAVCGSVMLETGASVDGDAVAVGGVLEQEPGARVGGESVSIGFLPVSFGMPTLAMLLLVIGAGWVLTVFVGWLFSMIAPGRTIRVGATVSRRTGVSLLLGIVSLPALSVAIILLFITVVGIPVGVLLPVLYTVMLGFGHVAATAVLGSRILRRPLGSGSTFLAIATGSAFVAMFFVASALLSGPPGFLRTIAMFFGALGALLSLGLSTIGIGAVMVSKFGAEPRDAASADDRSAPVPPASPIPSPSPSHSPGA